MFYTQSVYNLLLISFSYPLNLKQCIPKVIIMCVIVMCEYRHNCHHMHMEARSQLLELVPFHVFPSNKLRLQVSRLLW